MQHPFFVHSLPLFCTTTTWNFQKRLSYTFYGANVVRVQVHFFFSLPLIFTLHWWPLAFPILLPPLQNFHVVLPIKKWLLCLLSLAPDLCASLACLLLSLFLCLSPPLYSKFVATRKKKVVHYVLMDKKRIIREMPGIKKQLTVKKFRPPPPYIYFNWWLSVKAVNDDSYRNESKRKLFTMTLHDYDVKRPNFTFYGVPEHKTTIFISFSKLWQGPLERTSPASGKLYEME